MVAGAMNNFILAVIILLLIATFAGAPNLDPIIGSVETGGPAEQAGLEAGDRVTRINNDKVSTTDDLAIFLQLADMSKPVTFYVTKEDGTETTYEVTPIAEEVDGTTTYRIGVTIDNEVRHDVLSVLSYTARKDRFAIQTDDYFVFKHCSQAELDLINYLVQLAFIKLLVPKVKLV